MGWLDDDKNLVIMAVLILGIGVLWVDALTPEQATILDKMLIGLFGIAVGRGLAK